MIAIIADDLTGAAELGAVALRYGLSSEVQAGRLADSSADVVVLNTDSRSLPPAQAGQAAAAAAGDLRDSAEWVYKKVDSVLRGSVVAEIEAVLPALRVDRALLVPANPAMGRTIRDGQYLIGGLPLHRTGFAADKEHPAATSEVLDLLGRAGSMELSLLSPRQALPPRGIFVGQAGSSRDLAAWAAKADERTLPVGGAEFFAAVLQSRGHRPQAAGAGAAPIPAGGRLLVCGSSPPYARKTAEQASAHGVEVLPMPLDVFAAEAPSPPAIAQWAQAASAAMDRWSMAVVSIAQGEDRAGPANVLTAKLAEVAAAILGMRQVAQVFVEGGATAQAVVKRMGWWCLAVLGELAAGVASLQPGGRDNPVLTIKPGSYGWPDGIWPTAR